MASARDRHYNDFSRLPYHIQIISADHDRVVRVWNASTGKIDLMYVEHTSPVSTLAWSHDGTRIASSDDTTVQIWQAM